MADETFVLAVSGNGMASAGINDGDLISCRRTDSAKDGDIVYAIHANGRKTLSRYRKVGGVVRLYSETNDTNFAPYIRVLPKQMKILGIFQKVIKLV